jgi:NAD(P)-dependent dehydrogenase (short-subunit alcohol dehydrogenase family)
MDYTPPDLSGTVALVAGATRGAGRGIAVALGAAGATVWCTGRSTRAGRSEYDRAETIEETAELVDAAGGRGVAVRVDHSVPEQVAGLVGRIEGTSGRLDVLVNDVWGGEGRFEWNVPLWEQDLEQGLALVRRAVETHLITSAHALRLLTRRRGGLVVEMTDGTAAYNERNYRNSVYYDLAKVAVTRLAFSQAHELTPFGCTAVALTPGWLRSEIMLEAFGVTEGNWREATAAQPHFCISESPTFVGRAVAALVADPERARWSSRSLSSGELAQVYAFPDLDGTRPDCWRYLEEVVDRGLPPGDADYR